ncbi:DUF2332 family protein [Nocardioides sp. B-3]|uniref:DUF2332 family protein n=1 Tax=Nocardioides sp. B-3 TaxID=2895565 RepID=UPI003FA5A075
MRWPPSDYAELKRTLLERELQIKATLGERATQTNEVGRLATPVPVLAQVAASHGPLSLIEVGASAGLCLYPDRYDYATAARRRAHRFRGTGAHG